MIENDHPKLENIHQVQVSAKYDNKKKQLDTEVYDVNTPKLKNTNFYLNQKRDKCMYRKNKSKGAPCSTLEIFHPSIFFLFFFPFTSSSIYFPTAMYVILSEHTNTTQRRHRKRSYLSLARRSF